MNTKYLVVLALLAVFMAAGCAGKAQVKTTPETPILEPEVGADEELPAEGEVELDIEDIGLSGEELTTIEDMGSAEELEGSGEGSGLDELSVFE